MERLYSATSLHALHEAIKGDATLALALVKGSKVDRIFCQGRLDGIVDHVGYGLVIGGRAKPKSLMDLGVKVDRGSLMGTHGQSMTS